MDVGHIYLKESPDRTLAQERKAAGKAGRGRRSLETEEARGRKEKVERTDIHGAVRPE